MHLPEPERRELGENLVPLINIVFLLLIFFMVAGAIQAFEALDVTPPESTADAPPTDGDVLLVAADGRLALGERIFDRSELADQLAERDASTETDGEVVDTSILRVKADADTPSGTLLDVLEALREAGLDRVLLVTEQP